MTTLTIEIPEKVKKTLTDLVEQLGGKIVTSDPEKKINKEAKKQQILDDLEESVKWVKLHKEGKGKATSIQDLLNDYHSVY